MRIKCRGREFVSTPTKEPYQSPELRVYGTLRDLTLTATGHGIDGTPNCNSDPLHVSSGVC